MIPTDLPPNRNERLQGRVRGALMGSPILRNSSALYSSTIVTSALGFGFWALLTRTTGADQVGEAAAAISLMSLIMMLSTLGLDSLLVAELGRRPEHRVRLVTEAVHLTAAVAFVLSLIAGAVVSFFLHDRVALLASWPGVLLFATGTAAATAAAVLDLAVVGAGLPGRQLLRNTVASATKLAAVAVLALFTAPSATMIFAAWLLGTAVSVVVLLVRSNEPRRWFGRPRRGRVLSGLGRQAAGHHALNISAQLPGLVLPIVVTGILGPAENAAFFVALQIADFVWAVPTHLSTALFAVSARDHGALRSALRLSLRISAAVTALAVIGSALFGARVLGMFGEVYSSAAPTLTWLLATTLPASVMAFYVATCRVQGRLGQAAALVSGETVVQIGAGSAAAEIGMFGAAAGMTAPTWVMACAMWPRVARAAGYMRPHAKGSDAPEGSDA